MLGLAIGLCKGLGPLRVILSRFSGVSGFLRGGETVLGIAIGLCKGLEPLRVILSRFSGVSGFLRVSQGSQGSQGDTSRLGSRPRSNQGSGPLRVIPPSWSEQSV